MENNWVDFRAVKAAVSLQMVLDHYQINWLRKSNHELRGRCPLHQGEGENTFHANLQKNAFHCFSCKAKGNVLDFVAAMEHCSIREAAQKLQDSYSITPTPAAEATPTKTAESGGEPKPNNEPLKFQLKGIDPGHADLTGRGISKAAAESFGIGFFSGKGSMSGRIVIPIHNAEGELIAYAGRSIDDSEPKYKLPTGFHKSLVVYNLHRVREQKTVVLVEGFFGCMKVVQAGFRAVALMGSSLSAEQEELLSKHFSRVVLLFDGDDAGKLVTEECLVKLGRNVWVKAIALREGQQPDKLGDDELKRLLEEK